MARRVQIRRREKFIDQETLLKLLDQFVNDSYSGRRTKANGTRIGRGTVDNYIAFQNNLLRFLEARNVEFKVYNATKLNQRETQRVKKYYQSFYRSFTSYLYDDRKVYDNYVGFTIKILRIFFNYLEKEMNYPVGAFHRSFYIPLEEIQIIALNQDQLRYFIANEDMDRVAREHNLEVVKDVFVFGCTVALRVSDLLSLKKSNLIIKGDQYYISVKSKKTKTATSIKLPDYCVEILKKYKGKQRTLLPEMSMAWFNTQLKRLASLIPNNYEMIKTRERRGKPVVVYKDPENKIHYKLSDHITTHTMRRTAITTMLSLGMPEHMVRKISGHAPNSKEFFRYVELSQSVIDSETDRVFSAISS
ncbi:MAG: tyrosine-type recombinase/integrase [bacterium]|nr:tyrosine-type recombinase/integrase [bacterium]